MLLPPLTIYCYCIHRLSGVPSTFNFVQLTDKPSVNPLLNPYPDWSATEPGNCESGLTNVHRVKVDSCDRLWVLDTGTVGLAETLKKLCPITLNIYDLRTNNRIRKYELPAETINSDTFIANIELDEGHSCEDTFAYLTDELGFGLIVYTWEYNYAWRFNHSYFRPDPLAYDFNIGGINFQWEDEGVFGMSLSPKQIDGFKTLYFSPLTSNREFAVSTRTLKDPRKVGASHKEFIALAERGANGHVTARTMTQGGVQFFGLIDLNAVGCWNSAVHPYSPDLIGIADKDDEKLIFPSDVKLDRDENVWVVSNRLPLVLYSTLNYEEINFRVFSASAKELASGTTCEEKPAPYKELQANDYVDRWFDTKFW